VLSEGFRTAALLGMGGSSLCPEVFATIFGAAESCLNLLVLDTTDPGAILSTEAGIDPSRTLFLVSSKSGTTVETLSLYRYFRDRIRALGSGDAGRQFVAITDPGSSLEDLARTDGFRRTFLNPPDIGGRYSALSFFGLLPAALLGMDLPRLLDRASRMVSSCGPGIRPQANPGLLLGAILGEAARAGRDKLTFLLSPEVASFGYWVEQLVAESTGKEGRGLLPVEGEAPGPPSAYGQDRIVVYLRLRDADNRATDSAAAAFREAAHPLLRLDLDDTYDLGGEFLRWEVATATAGAILEVDPFDEPNVKESKDNTRRILAGLGEDGRLPAPDPLHTEKPLALYASEEGARTIRKELEQRRWTARTPALLAAFLSGAAASDYVALMAYTGRNEERETILQSIRIAIRDGLHLATTLGFGPRFLHSTGQYHKGGPDRGIFLQVTADDPEDLPVPETSHTFGTLKAAQAMGDLQALAGRGRRALRIHLSGDTASALQALHHAVCEAMALIEGREA
jgi:hypothetical protein